MLTHTISTTVTTSIVLDTGHYGRLLTVAASGEVAPAEAGVDGIAGPSAASNDKVTNFGAVFGGIGASAAFSAYAGGAGIDLAGGGGVTNRGVITGGTGGAGGYYGGNGGAGVLLGGAGTVGNTGTITGGAGGTGGMVYGAGGNGGDGVALTGGGTVINRGVITGGAGGTGRYPAQGGFGVFLGASGTMTNWGTIAGGAASSGFSGAGGGVFMAGGTLMNNGLVAGGLGADAVQIEQFGHLRNTGTMQGGADGGSGVVFESSGVAVNFGRIEGGAGPASQGPNSPGGGGGYGMLLRGDATLANYGTLTGGAGGASGADYGGTGGMGLNLETASTVLNAGTIEGGASGLGGIAGTGGIGVQLQSAGTLTNLGTIAGGDGVANAGAPTDIGRGGIGIYAFGGSSIVNHGLIEGGASAYGGYGAKLNNTNATLANSGTIDGGNGDMAGGAGVFVDGGTLASTGTIAGGSSADGARADAVQFGFYGGTLVTTPGSVFEGGIQGDPYADSTIVLAGHACGTLSGIGTNIVGITNFVEDAAAHWTLSGSLSGAGTLSIGADARMTVEGASSIGMAFGAGGYGTLALGSPGLVSSVLEGFGIGDKIELSGIEAASFTFHHDTLTLLGASHQVVDTMHFAGKLSAGDFFVFSEGRTTDIVYAGPGRASVPDERLHAGLMRVPLAH